MTTYIPGIGTIDVSNQDDLKYAGGGITDVGSDVSREIGLQKQLIRNDNFVSALNDPPAYLQLKSRAIKDLRTAIENKYLTNATELIKEGWSNEEATKEARKVATEEFKLGMKKIEQKFPVNVEKMISAKFQGKMKD